MRKLRPPFKCHGGKYYLCDWIVSHFPAGYETLHYGEPYAGAASVLLRKRTPAPGRRECLNDICGGIAAIWEAIKYRPQTFAAFLRAIPYTADSFRRAVAGTLCDMESAGLRLAVHEYTARRMSRGGLRKSFAWSSRLRGGKPGDVNGWETAIAEIPQLAARVRGVDVFNRDALAFIDLLDGPDCLLYCDPPYLQSTRTAKLAYGQCEMRDRDHGLLLERLKACRGKVIISGYPSRFYDTALSGWNRAELSVANHAGQSGDKQQRRECVWKNY